MKRKNYTKALLISAPAIALATLSACSDFDFDKAHGVSVVNELKSNYDASFAEAFGSFGVLNIDPTQTWGFDEMKTVEDYFGGATRAFSDPNANMWGGYINVPAPLTERQKQVVTNWFDKTQNPQGVAINFSDYFVQQVHKGTDYYTAHNGGSVCGSDHMDQLSDAMQHQFNYNNADMSWNENVWDGSLTNPDDPNSKIFHRDQIMLIRESSTAFFQYHGTEDSQWHQDCYVIIPGETIDPSNTLANTGESIWGMYFVAFDFFENGQNPNQQVDRDYFFDDWIVRITPGIFKNDIPDSDHGGSGSSTGDREESQQLTARIMCEDLGTTDDFDFNDVVFDVTFTSSTNAYIVLRAAGGTMPLYIGNPNEGGQEVHELFGVPVGTMVNTNNGSVSKPVATFNLPVTSTDPNDIPVVVFNNRQANAISYLLDANPGVAPRKICVTPDVDWADERVNIQNLYPNFTQWIQDHTVQFWDTPRALESATLNASIDKFNIMVGGTPANITYDTNSDGHVIIESSNPGVARVSNNQIIPVSAGTTTISIFVPKTNNYVATGSVTFEVTVRENDGSGNSGQDATYGQSVAGELASGMTIPAEYFADAQSKITISFVCNTNDYFSARIWDRETQYKIQGQSSLTSPNNGLLQFTITENVQYAKSAGIGCDYYNAMPLAVYVKCE